MTKQLLVLLVSAAGASAAPIINEIHFHPQGSPAENPAQEWIEIYNPDATAANVSGWKLSRGVTYTIPAATTIPAGGYLVIAADVTAFDAAHPAFAGVRVGGWVGRLANGGEQIQLDNELGAKVNDVSYSDQGDWGLRARGALSFTHRGWDWVNEADGGGKTLELRNPALGSGSGQNWGVSLAVGGSPGAVNSLNSTNVAPLIKDAKHRPEIPSSTQEIVVSCNLEDEASGAVATLYWRLDGGSFAPLPMSDVDGDGDVEASIPVQNNLSIVEWYISATDGVHIRTWPAPARTSNPGVTPQTFGQATNALVLVDNSFSGSATFQTPANSPTYRIVMTDAERDELVDLQTTAGEEDSEATFNATFVSHDGTGIKTKYNTGVRNRGQASALGPPNNYHVSFRNDDLWNGRGSIQLNCQFPHSQVLGNTLFARAGIPPQEAAIVRVRLNGVDTAASGSVQYGRYARLEGRGGEWAEHHYPSDADGNFYRLDDHAPGTNGTPPGNIDRGEFRYEGTDPASYADTYYKETNQDANDYSDLANLTRIVSAPATGGTAGQPAIADAAYPAAVATVLDVDQFYKFIATDALIGNQEGGLQSGRADDVSIYRGVVDSRFRFVPHDMDDVFNIGSGVGDPITRSIFSYDLEAQQGNSGVVGLTRLFNHPALVPRYYAALLEAMNTWFTSATVDPIVDQIMTGWVPAGTVTNVKGFVTARRTNVLSQIQQNYSFVVTAGGTAVDGNPRTNNGAATFSGTFNVARTYSITVNGMLATWSYRDTGAAAGNDDAGEWFLTVPAGGGGVLNPGLNNVVVRFWDGLNGTGNVIHEDRSLVLWQPATATYTNISGSLAPAGSLAITAPASYIPGIPFLVRVDLKDTQGNLDRAAWNRTATLTASGGITLTPNTVTLTNGMGSTLVTVGGGGSGTTIPLFTAGSGGTGSTTQNTGTVGSTWRYRGDFTSVTLPAFVTSSGTTWKDESFDDSSWPTIVTKAGYAQNDENRAFTRVDYNAGTAGTQSGPVYLFRSTFNIPNASAVTAVTGTIRYDDAYRIYVNGQLAKTGSGLTDTSPLTDYSTVNPGDTASEAVTIPVNLLHDGVNTIAIDIHQASATSSDVAFALTLNAQISSGGGGDPGNFTLTSSVGALNASKALTSLTQAPAMTNVAGTLPAGTTNWSGVINVTGDVTVPATGTLNIAPGTHVLVAGDAVAGSSAGADIIVTAGGVLNAPGTAAQPISITANSAANRWGELTVDGTATLQYCLLTHAGHSVHGGHTDTGPAIRLLSAAMTIEDSVVSDIPGKTMTTINTSGNDVANSDITVRRSHFGRCVMGPELGGAALLMEDCNLSEMLPAFREAGAADDEDCIYIHDSGGRPVNLHRSVFSNCGDDAVDLLGGSLTIEDCIIRNAFDKGVSLLNNDATIRRSQIIDNDIGVSTKCQAAQENTAFLNTFENCTIVSENHPTNTSDGTFHSYGVHTRNKYGTTTMNISVVLKNCIVSAEVPVANDYGTAPTPFPLMNFTYTDYNDLGGALPSDATPAGTGNIIAAPLYVDAAAKNFRLQPGSPARDTGDPASPLDADGSRADMGALPFGTTGGGGGGSVVWTPAGGPYRLTAATTVPAGLTLTIQAGTAVYADQNVRLTVNGKIEALGTPEKRITFSHVPGTVAAGDCDPIKLLTQTGPPKWGGIRVYDSMAQESVFKYCDFINAQGTGIPAPENFGSVGFVRSWGFCEGLTFSGTHLRMLYGRNCKLTVMKCVFPDMFIFDPILNRIEEPTTDFIAAADNNMEPLKVEFPVTDPEVLGANAPNFPNGLPLNGHWRVYYNEFHGNRGHQDVFDGDSGRWSPRDANNNQTNGQFMLDCRYNHFNGLAGDEHIDLGGDAYIASNIFENGRKDFWTNDTGYSNALSSGDKGDGTTIMVVRNICYDLDHVINCKARTGTIFEHNTVANFHADFQFVGQTVTQNVVCAPVNFFIPGDGAAPTNGDGAYMGFNIISNVPHVFSGPDASASGPITTKIEFFNNLLDQITDPVIGPNHPGGYFSGTYGPNQAGVPGFVNPAAENYDLTASSLARRTAPGGFDYGASIPEWAYIVGGPVGTTDQTSANFTIGGPGIVAYKWRLDGGAWSAAIQIGDGGLLPRATPTVRQVALTLNSLTPGAHILEVLGQDMAGNWQDNDPARTVVGAAQATPTSRTWTVDTTSPLVRISEVLANGTVTPDTVELHNYGSVPVNMAGWTLSDNPAVPGQISLTSLTIPAGGYAIVSGATLNLDKDGDSVLLYQGAVLKDSITFGRQLPDMTIGRSVLDNALAWRLGTPSLGAVNVPVPTGDQSGIRISEWFSDGIARYNNDWIEFSNSQSVPVDLGGLRLTDNRADSTTQFVIPPLTFIGGNGYAKLVCDNEPGHISFNLDATQDDISLLTASGTLLDTVQFYHQTTDYSQGSGFSFYELPTANLPNTTTDANALALLNGLRVTEIMYNAVGGSDYDYVVLTNMGPTPVNLGGVRFVTGITFTFPVRALGTAESVIVAKNQSKFVKRYGTTPVVAGEFGGQLDNAGETLAIQLPPPFDANILTFAYNDVWYPSSDGNGTALTRNSEGGGVQPAQAWGDRDTWTTGATGGAPGGVGARSDTFAGWMALNVVPTATTDDDQDGIPALVEFTLGMDPADGLGQNGPLGLPVFGIDGTGHATLTFDVPTNAGAAQSHGFSDTVLNIDASNDLLNWTTIATKTFGNPWTGTASALVGAPAGGMVPVVITDGTNPQLKRFLRVRSVWNP